MKHNQHLDKAGHLSPHKLSCFLKVTSSELNYRNDVRGLRRGAELAVTHDTLVDCRTSSFSLYLPTYYIYQHSPLGSAFTDGSFTSRQVIEGQDLLQNSQNRARSWAQKRHLNEYILN